MVMERLLFNVVRSKEMKKRALSNQLPDDLLNKKMLDAVKMEETQKSGLFPL